MSSEVKVRGERPVGATSYWFWAEIPKCSTATPHSNEKESIKLLANNTQFPVGKSPHGHRHRVTRTSVRHQFLGGTLRLLSLCLVLFVFLYYYRCYFYELRGNGQKLTGKRKRLEDSGLGVAKKR